MAIDTEQRRASSFIDECGIKIPPDGAFSATDRGWLVGQYAGIAAALVAEPIFPGEATFSGTGPGSATFTRTGPGYSTFTRTGPGSATFARKTNNN